MGEIIEGNMSKATQCTTPVGTILGKTTAIVTLILLVLEMFPLSILASGGFSPGVNAAQHIDVGSSFPITKLESPPQSLGAPLSVNATHFFWWNANWHYRRMYNVTGTGNVSTPVNFTELLTTLQVTNAIMENATVTVVRYHQNGSVAGVITTYEFKEDGSFDNDTNAFGTLTWQVPSSAVYYVYFDVKINKGLRSHLNETSNLSSSGNAQITTSEPAEGWWTVLSPPLASYYLPNEQVTIIVNTTARADKVDASFYYNGTSSFIGTFLTVDNLHWVYQTTFQDKGNWTVKINASDDVTYHAKVLTTGFFIGNPDLAFTRLTVNSAPYYRGKSLTIQAYVYCENATLKQVNVSLFVNGSLTSHQDTLTFQRSTNTTVTFTWSPAKKGSVNITVVVDPKDAIPESNEKNNRRTKILSIQGVPELGVVNITVPSQPIIEGNPATFYTCLTNKGDENATNYLVNLILEQTNTNYTYLESVEKNSTYVTIPMNHTVNISLVWSQVQYGGSAYHGRWVAGIRILINDSKPDSYAGNNTLARYDRRLQVVLGERNPPVITFLSIPQTQQQGLPAQFLITATDESGIDKVTIAIKNPQNKFFNGTMTPLVNNQYQYIFKNTSMLGAYSFTITAIDNSFNKIKKTVNGGFFIIADMTPPMISYADAYPFVQLSNNTVELSCIASDTSGIMGVDATIVFPDAHTEVHPMRNASNDMKYVYIGRFSRVGEYQYTIKVMDNLHNQNMTDMKVFWITLDLNDTDSDGMPDTWEKHYGFGPYDPSDAVQDADHDGVTNLEEYRAGSNPLAKESNVSDGLQILRDNGVYVLGFIIVCIIGGLVFYRFRRKK
jgi:hypothetical protein